MAAVVGDDPVGVATEAVLDLVFAGASLPVTLAVLAQSVERAVPGALCSILVLDSDDVTLRPGAGPSLPPGYLDNFDGAVIGPDVGSCGSAVHRREAVVVTDIATDPLWGPYRHLAQPHGLRACWSVPMLTADHPVGVLAGYFRAPGRPTVQQLETLHRFARLGALLLERGRVHNELDVAARAFTRLAETAGAWAWRIRLRPDPVLEHVNAPMTAGSGQSFEQLRRDPRLLERHFDADSAAVLRAARDGVPVQWPQDMRWTRPDGERRWLSVCEVPTHDAAGHHVGWDGIAIDVTARTHDGEGLRTADEVERRTMEHVQQLAELRAGVVAAVSHQVRTPLTVLKGMAETLLRHDDQLQVGERRELTERLSSRVDHLESLLGDLLDLRLVDADASAGPTARRRIDVAELLRSVGVEAGVDAGRIHGPGEPVSVEVPARAVENAIRRVFDNVVQHTPPTSQVWLNCAIEDDGGWLSMTVEDDGPGIEPARRGLLHHAFATVDPDDPRPRPGLGLPLAAATLVACGGRLDIGESRHGGTAVSLAVPLGGMEWQLRLL